MPSFEVGFDVYCSCGAGLCPQTAVGSSAHGRPIITVSPCERCRELARQQARDDTWDRAFGEGYAKGITEDAGGKS